MTHEEYDKVWDAYYAKFGVFPSHPPLHLGHICLSPEEDAAYMKAAIEADQPIDWYAIFPPLPEGAVS